MNTWSARVKERMKELEMTQEALARKLGVTRGAVTHYLAGIRQPPLKKFQKLATILKTEAAWLQFGIQIAGKETESSKAKRLGIPLLSIDHAGDIGNSKFLASHKEFLDNLFTDQNNCFAFYVKGDAMKSSSIHGKSFHEGDIIVINLDKSAENGDYVLALLPKTKEATFKQYVIDNGIAYLKPNNSQFPLSPIDGKTKILGVVIWHLAAIK